MTPQTDNRLRELLSGFQVTEALHAAALLAIPDELGDGARGLEALAIATGTYPAALKRLLRVLMNLEVITQDGDGRYLLTPLGQGLRSDAYGSWHPWAVMIGTPAIRAAWAHLTEAVRTGTTGFECAHGTDIWTHRARQAEEGALFDRVMQAGTERLAEPISERLGDLAGRRVVDVGGGGGTLLAHLMHRNPTATATLLDRAQAVDRARALFDGQQLSGRVTVVHGDFFCAVPSGGDLYLLKFVLHDWGDDDAVAILCACRRAIGTNERSARLVLIERLLDRPSGRAEAGLADLNMLVNTGGRERTVKELEGLLLRSGFQLASTDALVASLVVMQAVALPVGEQCRQPETLSASGLTFD